MSTIEDADLVFDAKGDVTDANSISYTAFINTKFKSFANYKNWTNLPHYLDGLKISQRKVLYSAIKKNDIVKVAQLSAFTAEYTVYHHGEAGLDNVCVNLAKNYTGGNNYNLLTPKGNYGSTLVPIAAAGRYIFTKIDDNFNAMFKEEDRAIVEYQFEDGDPVEPVSFIPLIPQLLINGTSGIGTGYACNVIMRNAHDIIDYITARISNKKQLPIINAQYKGFNGVITEVETGKVELYPSWKVSKRNIHITEVPPEFTMEKYKKIFSDAIENKLIRDYVDNSKKNTYDITLKIAGDADPTYIMKKLNLVQKISDNIVVWKDTELVTYETIYDYIEDFITARLNYYSIRIQYQYNIAEQEHKKFTDRLAFLCYVKDNIQSFIKMDDNQLNDLLTSLDIQDKSVLELPINRITDKQIDKLKEKITEIEKHIEYLASLDIKTLYLSELKTLKKQLK